VIGQSVSHYKILKKIGGGGMGIVYKAEDTKLRRTVALKFLAPELTRDDMAKKRFLHEAQGASALDHPNICSIHEIDETDIGQMFICMSFYEGAALKDQIAEGPLPASDVFEIAYCMADALAHAHERGIVHRDIKPGNIMITAEGFVKIVDFGLAKLRGRSKVTVSGTTLGTVAYMSPEQANGTDIDGRTDIWSLGVVLYEALTGELPFRGDVDNARLYSIINEDPRPLREIRPEIPEEFAALIHRCLEKDSANRFKTADELLEALRAMAKKLGWHSSGSLRSVIRVGTAKPASRIPAAVVVVAGIVLVAAVVFFGREFLRRGVTDSIVYTTDVRLAVLPLKNLAGDPFSDQFVHGLSERIADLTDLLSNSHGSMWVVPFYRTQLGRTTLAEAKDAFGVNRLLTGNIQRYADGHRLSLELLDAETSNRIDAVDIDFTANGVGDIANRVIDALRDLFDTSPDDETLQLMTSGGTWSSQAFQLCMEGLGYLQRYQAADNTERAVDALRNATKFDLDYALGHAALGQALFRHHQLGKGPFEAAELQCQKAVGLDTTNVFAHTQLGEVYFATQNWEGAASAYASAIDLNPRLSRGYRRLADVYWNTQRIDEAEEAYRRMIALKPDYFYGHLYLGFFLSNTGRVAEGTDEYKTALLYAPNDSWTLNAVGVYYHQKDRWTEAREYYQRSFAVRPECETCVNIGILYYYDGLYAEAAKYYEFAFAYCDSTTDENFYMKWNHWGDALYWTEGRRHEASDKYREALRLAEQQRRQRPRDANLIGYIAGLYAMLDRKDEAVRHAEEAAALAEEDGFVQVLLSYTYEKLNDREKALHHAGKALRNKFPLRRIQVEPMLRDLVQDTRFQQMVDGIDDASE
jgi:serine/threonine-protein kinase